MNVDLTTNAASLQELYNRYPKVIDELNARDKVEIMTALHVFDDWDIDITFTTGGSSVREGAYFAMNQVDFFKMVDLMLLIRIKSELFKDLLYQRHTTIIVEAKDSK